jgi:hypothetical protein
MSHLSPSQAPMGHSFKHFEKIDLYRKWGKATDPMSTQWDIV